MDINWSDVDCTVEKCQNYQWFVYNPANFTAEGISSMNEVLVNSSRGIVVIADPTLKVDTDYPVYAAALAIQESK